MGVSVYWQNPQKTKILMTFVAPWTWDDYERVSPQIDAMLASVTHRVDLMINVTHAGTIPADSMLRLRESYAEGAPNLGEYIFVGAPEEFKSILRATDRYYTALGGSLSFSFA